MATLTIEGDPLAIRGLVDELTDRHYLGSEFRVEVIESVPTLMREEAEKLVLDFQLLTRLLGSDKYREDRMDQEVYLRQKAEEQCLRAQLLTALCADPNAALLEALIDARSALQSLPADALGMVHAKEDRYEWPIRDELVAKIDRAIAAEEENRCQLAESGN